MNPKNHLQRWAELVELRGIAGVGARETDEEKRIVERSVINDFCSTIHDLLPIRITKVHDEKPPQPDFSAIVLGQQLRFELVEFIDQELIQQAKGIRRSPDHPLHTKDLWFETSQEWFAKLLLRTIEKKDEIYRRAKFRIDVLLVWNEAVPVGIEDTDRWLSAFEQLELSNISSVYFQSWYHPSYRARPTWSVKTHPLIGKMSPTSR